MTLDALKVRTSLILRSVLKSPRRSRELIITDFNATLHDHFQMINPLSVERRGLIDPENASSNNRTSESELSPRDRLTIADLQLDKEHPGQFLLCRIIAGSYQVVSVCTLIEDPNGTVERLNLYNWSDTGRTEAWNLATRRCIPIGTILAIRNPYYVVGTDRHTLIRCDKPTDVIIFKNNHPLLEEVSWRCPSIQTNGLRLTPKLARFGLRSGQLMKPANTSNLHYLCTPPRNLPEKEASRKMKCSKKRRHEKMKETRNHGKSLIVMAQRSAFAKTFNRDGNAILASCFIIFVWYVFFM